MFFYRCFSVAAAVAAAAAVTSRYISSLSVSATAAAASLIYGHSRFDQKHVFLYNSYEFTIKEMIFRFSITVS